MAKLICNKNLHFGSGAKVGLGLGFGLGTGMAVDTPGIGAGVAGDPVNCPLVGKKLHTGLKQHGLAASLINLH